MGAVPQNVELVLVLPQLAEVTLGIDFWLGLVHSFVGPVASSAGGKEDASPSVVTFLEKLVEVTIQNKSVDSILDALPASVLAGNEVKGLGTTVEQGLTNRGEEMWLAFSSKVPEVPFWVEPLVRLLTLPAHSTEIGYESTYGPVDVLPIYGPITKDLGVILPPSEGIGPSLPLWFVVPNSNPPDNRGSGSDVEGVRFGAKGSPNSYYWATLVP